MGRRKVDTNIVLQLFREGKNQKQIAEHFKVSAVAIHKRLKKILPRPQSLDKLTVKERRFVIGVVEGKSKTQAVMESFDVSSRASAKAMQNALMQKDDIQIAIAELMEIYGLTRGYRINKLKSHIDHLDPGISLKGLDMSFKLDGLFSPEKHINMNIDLKTLTDDLKALDEEERRLRAEIERRGLQLAPNEKIDD